VHLVKASYIPLTAWHHFAHESQAADAPIPQVPSCSRTTRLVPSCRCTDTKYNSYGTFLFAHVHKACSVCKSLKLGQNAGKAAALDYVEVGTWSHGKTDGWRAWNSLQKELDMVYHSAVHYGTFLQGKE